MAIFHDLSVELRDLIWGMCLSDVDAPEIYCYDPGDFARRVDSPSSSGITVDEEKSNKVQPVWHGKEVLTGFPVIMHVCREARLHAQHSLSFRTVRNTRTHVPISVPARPYCPDTDVFFVTARFWRDFYRWRFTGLGSVPGAHAPQPKDFLGSICHLAVEGSVLYMMGVEDGIDDLMEVLEDCLSPMAALRRLSFVLEGVERMDGKASRWELVPFCRGDEIEDLILDINNRTATWEVEGESLPWDEESGNWLFETQAMRLVKKSGRM